MANGWTGSEHPRNLFDRAPKVVDVMERHAGDDGARRGVTDGQTGCIGLDDSEGHTRMSSSAGGCRRALDAHDSVAQLLKCPPGSSLATSDLDDEPSGRWEDSPQLGPGSLNPENDYQPAS